MVLAYDKASPYWYIYFRNTRLVGSELPRCELESRRKGKQGGIRIPYFAHPASPEGSRDFIRPKFVACGDRHSGIQFSLQEGFYRSDRSGLSRNLPTTERAHSIAYKSAISKGTITNARIHLVVQGTNSISGR